MTQDIPEVIFNMNIERIPFSSYSGRFVFDVLPNWVFKTEQRTKNDDNDVVISITRTLSRIPPTLGEKDLEFITASNLKPVSERFELPNHPVHRSLHIVPDFFLTFRVVRLRVKSYTFLA